MIGEARACTGRALFQILSQRSIFKPFRMDKYILRIIRGQFLVLQKKMLIMKDLGKIYGENLSKLSNRLSKLSNRFGVIPKILANYQTPLIAPY